MGHKTHPYGFRLGIIKDWKTHWYANNGNAYRKLLLEDLKLRDSIKNEYRGFSDAGIARVEIDRGAQDSVINIHSARPGILIGRDGERVKQLRSRLEGITQHRIQLNIIEIEQPELDPFLIGRNIAEQLQRRVAYRRAIRQAAQRAMQAGALGIKIIVKGRISGSEIARVEKLLIGQVPLHTLRADINYALSEAATAMGRIGIKVWVYRGQILPPVPEVEEELDTIRVRVESGAADEDETEAIADDVIGGVATRGAFDVAT
jgi:small subunit ribosomal protein S3